MLPVLYLAAFRAVFILGTVKFDSHHSAMDFLVLTGRHVSLANKHRFFRLVSRLFQDFRDTRTLFDFLRRYENYICYILPLKSLMHQSFEMPEPPPPPLGHERGKRGAFTSDSLHFGSPLGGGCARNHGLRMPDWGVSGAVTPCSAVWIIYVDSLGRSVALWYFAAIRCLIARSKNCFVKCHTRIQYWQKIFKV